MPQLKACFVKVPLPPQKIAFACLLERQIFSVELEILLSEDYSTFQLIHAIAFRFFWATNTRV